MNKDLAMGNTHRDARDLRNEVNPSESTVCSRPSFLNRNWCRTTCRRVNTFCYSLCRPPAVRRFVHVCKSGALQVYTASKKPLQDRCDAQSLRTSIKCVKHFHEKGVTRRFRLLVSRHSQQGIIYAPLSVQTLVRSGFVKTHIGSCFKTQCARHLSNTLGSSKGVSALSIC